MTQATASAASATLYETYVNPQWLKLLDVLNMNARYERCLGAELHTSDGRRILDFLSGYCVLNTGHNHPAIVAVLKDELDRSGPAMLQSHVPELAGELAQRLVRRAGGRVGKVYFCSSGSEAVETAIKFSRAHTGRSGLLYAEGAFHGLTCGALSLMGDQYWRDRFGPLLADTAAVPFGDLAALEKHLATRRYAAFIVEPIQGEAGIKLPPPGYLEGAQALARRYGALFVLDEVQTGMYRTGPFLAAHHFNVEPDMVLLAKALSGGLVPCGAVLMSDAVYASVYDSLKHAIVHTSTFGENSLAMRAGLATLDVLEGEGLGPRATLAGEKLRASLKAALSPYPMVKEVRGLGLFSGIEFAPPKPLRLRVPFQAFHAISPGMFGQVLVMHLFQEKGVLAQICGNNYMVLKAAPPLVASDLHLDTFVTAMRDIVDKMHSSSTFWTEALGMARRVVGI